MEILKESFIRVFDLAIIESYNFVLKPLKFFVDPLLETNIDLIPPSVRKSNTKNKLSNNFYSGRNTFPFCLALIFIAMLSEGRRFMV